MIIKSHKRMMKGRLKKIYGKLKQMEREQKKKNLVVNNQPESKREEAIERYREDKEACRTIFVEGIRVQQVEQKKNQTREKRGEQDQTSTG